MGADVRNDRGRYLLSAISAEGAGTTLVTGLGHTDTLLVFFSGGAEGVSPTAGISANFEIQHAHDATAWTTIAEITASAGEVGTALYTVGPMGYIRANVTQVYSAAQTGTGVLAVFARPGMR